MHPWRAEEFEKAAAQAGLVVTAKPSFEEWDHHPLRRRPTVRVGSTNDNRLTKG